MDRRARSYTAAFGLDGRVCDESDATTCAHCQFLVRVATGRPGSADAPGFCRSCMAIICRRCEAARECTPFMRAIERSEERGRRARAMGL